MVLQELQVIPPGAAFSELLDGLFEG